MYIYIVRHGQTLWNLSGKTQGTHNIPLSLAGIRQAKALGHKLKQESITQIYTSDLDRAYKTAEIIGQSINVNPFNRLELREICFGLWEGLTREEIKCKFPGQLDLFHNDCSFTPLNGESLECVRLRINAFLDAIHNKKNSEQDSILIVSHAITSKVLIVELLGLPLNFLWSFKLDNASISKIHIDGNKKTLSTLNDTCHLSGF